MNYSLVSTVIRAFLKWWWLIALCAALGVGVGYFVRADQPDIYAAKATVLVGQDPRFVTSSNGGNNNTLLEAYSVFAKRPSILQPVIDELGLSTSPDDLSVSVELNPNREASLLEIIFYDIDPERAALIANRIAIELVNQSLRSGSAVQNAEFVVEQLSELEGQISVLQAQYRDLVNDAAGISSAFSLNQNLLERQRIDALLQDLRTTYADLSSTLTNTQSQVSLFEEAQPSYWPVASSSTIDLVFAGVAGVILAILTIVLITFFDDRLQWQEDNFDTVLGQRVLGPMGIIAKNKLPLYSMSMPGSVEVEALRQIRDKLFISSEKRPQVLTFVSYDSGDGKTLTTSNMAVIFANSGLRTIILDLDMRKGDLHEVFRVPNVIGMSDVLATADNIEDLLPSVILDTGIENLSVITMGRSNADPSSLLSRSRFPQLIYLLRQEYDVVVMDSVPTIAGTDVLFLAEVSDGLILVVNARRTTQTGLKRAIASLKEAQGANILGVVFNRVRLQVTSKYNNPYYHPSATLRRAQQLNQELLKPKGNRGLFNLRARVLTAHNGELMYSTSIAAQQLGVRERTVHNWIRTGYLKAERHILRQYVRDTEIQNLLKRLPSHNASGRANNQNISEQPQTNQQVASDITKQESVRLPDQLREQRAALLDFVSKPVSQSVNDSDE